MSVAVRIRILYFGDDLQYRGDAVSSGIYAAFNDALSGLDDAYSNLQSQVNTDGGFVIVENTMGEPPKMIRPSLRRRVLLPGENN